MSKAWRKEKELKPQKRKKKTHDTKIDLWVCGCVCVYWREKPVEHSVALPGSPDHCNTPATLFWRAYNHTHSHTHTTFNQKFFYIYKYTILRHTHIMQQEKRKSMACVCVFVYFYITLWGPKVLTKIVRSDKFCMALTSGWSPQNVVIFQTKNKKRSESKFPFHQRS